MFTVIHGDFEWDEAKAASNLEKHGVSFEEAATAITDPMAQFFEQHVNGEARTVAIGMSLAVRILFVVHVERGERDRIISARRATRAEKALYDGRKR